MDFDLKAAQDAEDAYKDHHNQCDAGCQRQGTIHEEGRGFPRNWRCESGRKLWQVWQSFRPTALLGDRTLPDGQQSDHVVVQVQTVDGIAVVELRLSMHKSRTGVKEWRNHATTRRDLYLDGHQEWADVGSTEMALLLAIASRHGQERTSAAFYAGRVLGLTDSEMGESE